MPKKSKVEVDTSSSEEDYDDEIISHLNSIEQSPKPLDELKVNDKLYITVFSPTKYGFLLTDIDKNKYYSNYDVNKFLNKFITDQASKSLITMENNKYKLKKKLVLICKETKTFKKDDKEYQNNYFEYHLLKR